MSEGLKTLKLFEKDIEDGINKKYIDVDFANELLRIIRPLESELKQREELAKMYTNSVVEGAKLKKALEIIKKYPNLNDLLEWAYNHDYIETLKEVSL